MPKREKAPAQPRERVETCDRLDQPLLMLILLLLGLGLVCLFSASYATAYENHDGNSTYFFIKQAGFAAGGVACMLGLSQVDYRKLHLAAIPFLFAVILLMATIKVPGLDKMWVTINDATRWIKVPGIGINFQPSELAKMAVILSFSSVAAIFGREKMRTFRWGILPFVIVLGVFAAEMVWEKHLSGALIIAVIGIAILFFAGAHLAWFGAGIAGVAGAALLYIKKNKYAMARIEIWLDPFRDMTGGGWQGSQSQMAIGSGGFWGLGLGQSRQKHLYLPEPANDFIFAVWCEELGFVGGVLLVILFAMLIWRGFYVAKHAPDRFGTLLAAGITTKIAVQTFLNLAVVTGLFPITGASLPFFSYGGTALVFQLIEMGILLGVSRKMPAVREG